jgi:hypothetical protein
MSALRQPDVEDRLIAEVESYVNDPLGFVYFAFPWGEDGTPLAGLKGPDQWQEEVLAEIGAKLALGDLPGASQVIREAVSSGKGIGKSALVAMLVCWAMSTMADTRGVVTANNETQLRTKTWAEVSKWYQMLICRHWFKLEATSIHAVDPDHEKTWRIDIVLWNEKNPEAFAGLHNQGRRILVVMDESSHIPDVIHDTTDGALTDADTQIIWCCFGNPTRPDGRFREYFDGGRFAHRWSHRKIDSRSVRITNKAMLAEWVEDWGEDSDYVRMYVRGEFPRIGSMQFISAELVDGAFAREPVTSIYSPLIMGCDVARFGDDMSVIRFRKGLDAVSHPPMKFRGIDTMVFAAKIADAYNDCHADMVFVDEGGVGGGVVDRLRQLKIPCIGVNFAGRSDRAQAGDSDVQSELYANKRAEMYGSARRWLARGAVAFDADFKRQATSVEYGYVVRDGKDAIQLEKKESMRKRGLDSPDDFDAFVLTFAYPVQPNAQAGRFHPPGAQFTKHEYDPLDAFRDLENMAEGMAMMAERQQYALEQVRLQRRKDGHDYS